MIPTIDDLLHDLAHVIIAVRDEDRCHPALKHATPHDGARYMLRVLTCGREIPGPTRRRSKGEDYWVWPERDRLVQLARMFLAQTEDFQRYIVAAQEDGIQWRGDPEWFFRFVVDETEKMQSVGIETYKQEASERLRRWLAAPKANSGNVSRGERGEVCQE